MPTYAILGATGATGAAILRSLLSNPPPQLKLKLLVRSRSKLLALFPNIEANATIIIIEGLPTDTSKLQECLRDVSVIFGCIATNTPSPNMSLVTDTTIEIISALKALQSNQKPSYSPPTILQLRSASLNPEYKARFSYIAQSLTWFFLGYIYEDLQHASDLLAEQNPSLLRYVFVDPPSLHDQDGTMTTGYELVLNGELNDELSYADLGAAFCEVAERSSEFDGLALGVSATGMVRTTWAVNLGFLMSGVKARLWG